MQIIPVTCVGEGPVVYVEPTRLDWGVIPVLQSNVKIITLTNESVIPAVFTIKTVSLKLQRIYFKIYLGAEIARNLPKPVVCVLFMSCFLIRSDIFPI